MLHLATRSLSDLLTAVHLASHAYLQQAYGALRPVYENCDLIELLARDSAEAAAWIKTDKPWTEFAPGAVRRRLGALPDPVYSHVTEMGTHPRFAGSRLTGVMEVARDDAAMRTAVLRVGCFFPEHPASVLVYTFLFDGVVRLGFKLRHLTQVSRETSHDAWCDALLESTIAVRRGCSLIRAELVDIDGGEGSEFLEAAYVEVVEGLQPGGQLRTGHP